MSAPRLNKVHSWGACSPAIPSRRVCVSQAQWCQCSMHNPYEDLRTDRCGLPWVGRVVCTEPALRRDVLSTAQKSVREISQLDLMKPGRVCSGTDGVLSGFGAPTRLWPPSVALFRGARWSEVRLCPACVVVRVARFGGMVPAGRCIAARSAQPDQTPSEHRARIRMSGFPT